MNINYDYYRLFYYVAKYKSLSLVAKLLNSNQPNLTKLMNKLEMQMGCKLMIRTNKGITLTSEGEQLFRHVSVAYNELRAAEAELSMENDMGSGMICIGNTSSAYEGVMVSMIVPFRKTYPNIRISITGYTTLQAIDALKQGIIDFAVVDAPFFRKTDFRQTSLMHYKEVLVAAASSSYGKLRTMKLANIQEHPIIGLCSYSNADEYHSKIFAEHGLVWNPDIGVSRYSQIIPMVTEGLGIAFVPDFMARPYLESGKLVEIRLAESNPQRELVLLEDKEQHSSIAARRLIRYIKNECRSHI